MARSRQTERRWGLRRRGRLTRSFLCGLALLSLVAPACSMKGDSGGKVTVTYWVSWSGREFQALQSVLSDFERSHPRIHVEAVSGVGGDTTKLAPAIRAGRPPDLAAIWDTAGVAKLCTEHALVNLTRRMASSHVELNQFVQPAQRFITEAGRSCGLPVLGDDIALYYNTKLFREAGISAPPKTFSELSAAAKSLTRYNADGSIRVAGYLPLFDVYENYPDRLIAVSGAQWFDGAGKATTSKDPRWSRLFLWQRSLVDALGYKKLTRFAATLGQPDSAQNAFETGQLAMVLDGEWRTQFIAKEHPDLPYATAPFPVPDDEPDRYGASQISATLNVIPSAAKHPNEAWTLARYLGTNTATVVKFANSLHNVPLTVAALHSSALDLGPHIGPFLSAYENPLSTYPPALPAGAGFEDPVTAFVEKWQAGKVPISKLHAALAAVDIQIDAYIQRG